MPLSFFYSNGIAENISYINTISTECSI